MRLKAAIMGGVASLWICSAVIAAGYFFLRNYPHGFFPSCPTAADLAGGIVFEDHLRSYTVTHFHKHVSGSVYRQTFKIPVVINLWRNETFMGLMKLSAVDTGGSQRTVTEYSEGLEKLFPLKQGNEVRFTGHQRVNDTIWKTDYRVVVGATEIKSIGSCSYEVFPLQFKQRLAYSDGSGRTRESLRYYSPELSFVLTEDSGHPRVFEVIRKPSLLETFKWPFNGEALED